MCTVVEKFTNEGIEQDQKQIIINMWNQDCDKVTISRLTGIPMDKVNKVIDNQIRKKTDRK